MSDFIPNKCLKLIKWQRWIKLDMFSVSCIILIQMNINFYFSGVDVYPPLLKLYKKIPNCSIYIRTNKWMTIVKLELEKKKKTDAMADRCWSAYKFVLNKGEYEFLDYRSGSFGRAAFV